MTARGAVAVGRATEGRLFAVAAILGGLGWSVLRPAIAESFAEPLLGLTYLDLNRLMLPPVALLLLATLVLVRREASRAVRAGAVVLAVGLALSFAGVAVEFVIGTGLSGDRGLAMAGWGIYGLGVLGQALGSAALGLAVMRSGRLGSGAIALGMGVLHLAWLPLIAAGAESAAVGDQVLIGLGWVLLGVLGSGRGGDAQGR